MGRVTRSTDSFPTLQTPAETRKEQGDGNMLYIVADGGFDRGVMTREKRGSRR